MNFLLAVSLVLSIFGNFTYAPAELLFTLRFEKPVYGEVCVEAWGDETSGFAFKSSCEDINGRVKQIRWRAIPPGRYEVRAKFRGGTELTVTQPQHIEILAPAGWGER